MEPIRDTHATLVDLLDRILDKGLVINADIIISVAGIPLIGVNLRAALAGMETMLKYGVMQAWDERTRAWEREHRGKKELSLTQGEEVILKMFGSYYYSEGIYTAWRSGYFYLTDKRLLLHRQDFNEVMFEIPLEEIKSLVIKEERHFTKEGKEVLYLIDRTDRVSRLHAAEMSHLKDAIEKTIKAKGLFLEENPILPEFEEKLIGFLMEGEKITHRGKIWHLMTTPAPGGVVSSTWRPGRLYLTNKRLCWWYDFDRKVAFEVLIDKIAASMVEIRDLSAMLKRKKALDVIYETSQGKKVACFSGKSLGEWEKALNRTISRQGATAAESEIEICPQCGQKAPTKELLEKGCSKCGWVSPKLKKKLAQAAK
ncbi:MAG: gas vesicle protein [Actinomycetota bacterium]|nr:gas vesicle protein [Actinomycetota bacterium]